MDHRAPATHTNRMACFVCDERGTGFGDCWEDCSLLIRRIEDKHLGLSNCLYSLLFSLLVPIFDGML